METVLKLQADKLNYFRGLVRIAKCNGVVEPEEREYLSLIAKGLGVDTAEEQRILDAADSEEPLRFSTHYIAVFFIQEAIQLCAVDNSFDEAEKNEIKKIAQELSVAQTDLQGLISWVTEGLEWKKRGEKLVAEIAERR